MLIRMVITTLIVGGVGVVQMCRTEMLLIKLLLDGWPGSARPGKGGPFEIAETDGTAAIIFIRDLI